MAHELSHCVYQNHNADFYKLMEDILVEHATLLAYGLSVPLFLQPTNAHLIQRDFMGPRNNNSNRTRTATAVIDDGSRGRRLGGDEARSGRSRLLDFNANGRKLGGGSVGRRILTPHELRQRAVQAAEARQRQLQQVRTLVDTANEPCWIEILDDDDDDDDNDGKKQAVDIQSPATKRVKKHQPECIDLVDDDSDDGTKRKENLS
jgi:hypothetical protein